MREKKHTYTDRSQKGKKTGHTGAEVWNTISLFLFYTRVELYLNYSLGIKNNLALFFIFLSIC